MAQPILFQRETHSGAEQGTTIWPEGNSTVFSRLPHYDFLTFIAIAQRMPGLRLFDFIPSFQLVNSRRGLSGVVHLAPLLFDQSVAFKRFLVTRTFTEGMAYKALICELLVLEHPILKRQRNILELLGVAWDIQTFEGRLIRAMPVLVFKNADRGTLVDFMNPGVSFMQRIQFCRDIGKAIEAMHGLNIVHGDIKPANVLIFEDETGLVAKVIDFGCSCFGSKDNDLVLLSRTAQWAAPEIGDAHMSIRAAKLTDIYSYGMVCAWIFFGQDMPAADFVRLPSNFEHAAERLMRIGETEIEESQDTFLMLSTSVHSLREFFKSSFQAAHERRARNVKSLLDQLDRVLTGWNTRQEISNRNRPFFVDLFLTLSNALKLSRIENYIHASIVQLLTLLLLGRKNKPFVPGLPQLICGDSERLYILFLTGICVAALSFFIIMFIIAVKTFGIHSFETYTGIGVGLVLCTILGCFFHFCERWDHFWNSTRHIWRSISIYGQIQHAIPNLPDIYSFLNKTHYLVREHLVTELEKRSQSGCVECQSDAAVHLAFCYHTALGTPRDVNASENWLKFAKKKEKHLLSLCRDVNYRTDLYNPFRLLVLGGRVFPYFTGNLEISNVDKYYESSLPTITRRLSQEIDGKRASKVGLHTIGSLSHELGMIYLTHGDHESAEHCWRSIDEAGERPDGSRWSHLLLAQVLDDQGKEREALDELLVDKNLMINPNGRIVSDAVMKLHGLKFENRQFDTREWLADLLIRQGKSDMALKLDLFSDLDDLRLYQRQDSNVMLRILENILSLAQLLSRQMRKGAAADLLRKRLKVHVEIFGASHLKTMKATSDLIFMLSDMGAEHVDEAIALQSPTLDRYEEHHCENKPNAEVLLLKTAFAFALSRKRRFDEAIAKIDLVLQYKKRCWTREQHGTQGCTSDLASSLFLQGEREYLTPAVMQYEMLVMSKETQSLELKAQIVAILCTMPRRGSLGEVLGMLRILEQALKDENSDRRNRRKVRGFIVFILANLGLCFENSRLVEEALGLSIAMNEEMIERSNWNDMDRVYVVQLLASVYWIKSFIACQFHGFGKHDLSWMDQAEQIHRETMAMVTAAFGDTHEETAHAIRKTGTLLARHGTALADLHLLNQSTELDSRCDSIRGRNVLYEHTTDPGHPGYLAEEEREARQRLQNPILEIGEARRSLSNVLKKLRTYYLHSNKGPDNRADYHPQTIRTLEALAQAYWLEGKTFQAQATSKYVMHLARRAFASGDDHTSTMAYRILLMKPLLHDEVMFPKKVETARELLKHCVERFGKQHTQTISCMNELVWILCQQGRNTEAVQLMREALELGLTFLGVRHRIISQLCTTFLGAIDSTPAGSSHLLSRVSTFTFDLKLPWSIHGNFLKDLPSKLLSVDDDIKRMTFGMRFLGEEHILTRLSVDSFVLILQCHFGWSLERAVQALQKFKNEPWSGFRPSVTARDDEGLFDANYSNRSDISVEI